MSWAWEHGEYDDARQEDETTRFGYALAFSVFLHAVILFAWKLPPRVWAAADHAVLTVILRGAALPAPQAEDRTEPLSRPSVLVKVAPDPVVLAPAPRVPVPTPKPVVSPQRSAAEVAAPAGRLAPQSAPGRLSNKAPAPIGVSVLLVVGDDGRVGEIFWSELPALNDEQLRRVETAIRAKTYAPRQNVREVFDVRGFLRLPAVRLEAENVSEPEKKAD